VVQLPPGQSAGGRLAARQTATQCHELGARVALLGVTAPGQVDGFGGGLDMVKLDRALLAEDGAAAPPVVAAATRAGATVIAFGVEDARHALRAKELGCHWAQGYHYGRPRQQV
jgi:EAL domain-containing protein (putative c-di-GMP-specific phosphodiesterase class I)